MRLGLLFSSCTHSWKAKLSHAGPAESCSLSPEFFQALSSTQSWRGHRLSPLPAPQPIQVRSIPLWPHLGWHWHLSKCQDKLGQNYHKLDLMETFFQRQELGVKFSSTKGHWMKWKKQNPAAALPWSLRSPQQCQFQTCVFLHPMTSSCRNLYFY